MTRFKEKLQRALHHQTPSTTTPNPSTPSTSPTSTSTLSRLSTSPTSILTTCSRDSQSTAPSTFSTPDSPSTPHTPGITQMASAPPPTPMHPKSPLSKTLSFHKFRSNIEGRRMPWDTQIDDREEERDVPNSATQHGDNDKACSAAMTPAETKAQIRREHQQLLGAFEWGGGGQGHHGEEEKAEAIQRKATHTAAAVSPRTGSLADGVSRMNQSEA